MGAGTPAPDLSRPGLEVAPLLLGCVLRVGDVAAERGFAKVGVLMTIAAIIIVSLSVAVFGRFANMNIW